MVNSDKKFFLLCPVPEDQKPINEYLRLKKNSFFNSIPFLSFFLSLSEKGEDQEKFSRFFTSLLSFRNGKKTTALKVRSKQRSKGKRTSGSIFFPIFFLFALSLLCLFFFFFFTKPSVFWLLPEIFAWPFVGSFVNRLTFTSFLTGFFSFSFTLIGFFYFVIFFRWYQLEKTFEKSRFFYEEASWYDGQFWEKPLSLIKNDHLLLNQKIKPILIRIQTLFLQFFVFNFLISIVIRN